MNLTDILAQIENAKHQLAIHNGNHLLGHIGCMSGSTCEGWSFSWEEIDAIEAFLNQVKPEGKV